jgi:3-hydroxyacyl-[acyl-carrier protein] dehydratase/trans-2-decenoyl-[acyl-carrier protein] isomerase
MKKKSSYNLDELITCAKGELFGTGNAQLPLPPMLMFSRITNVNESDGPYKNGQIIAELDINPNLWFFDCHFLNDPVMPGCLGLDAMWQLLGFYLGWLGKPGKGRALGAGEVKFSGQVTKESKLLTYQVDISRVICRSFTMGIADAHMICDNKLIYTAKTLKVGLFEQGQTKSSNLTEQQQTKEKTEAL